MLSGIEILKQVELGNIEIIPFNKTQVNPNSYNLTLGKELFVYTETELDCAKINSGKSFVIPPEGFVLQPGEFYIANTNEYTKTHSFIPQISGRSSIGRIGLTVHLASGFGEVGFEGKWTLILSVLVPVRVYPDMQIGQIYYFPVTGEYEKKYKGRYQTLTSSSGSKLYQDF